MAHHAADPGGARQGQSPRRDRDEIGAHPARHRHPEVDGRAWAGEGRDLGDDARPEARADDGAPPSTPAKRLEAIKTLSEAGIPVAVMMAPRHSGAQRPRDRADPRQRQGGRGVGGKLCALAPAARSEPAVSRLASAELSGPLPHVMSLVRSMRDGKDYDAEFGKRMKGAGPYAWQISRRFEMATKRLGLMRRSLHLEKICSFRPTATAFSCRCCSEWFAFVIPVRLSAASHRMWSLVSRPCRHDRRSGPGLAGGRVRVRFLPHETSHATRFSWPLSRPATGAGFLAGEPFETSGALAGRRHGRGRTRAPGRPGCGCGRHPRSQGHSHGPQRFQEASAAQREALYDRILSIATVSIASSSPARIDLTDIRKASLDAMRRAVAGLGIIQALTALTARCSEGADRRGVEADLR